jgi:ketosteroid isomerase-like protein
VTNATDLENRLDVVESQRAIERVIADYAHAWDHVDAELLGSLWYDDADFDLGDPFGVFTGPRAIEDGARGIWKEIEKMHHWMANPRIDIDGDTASGVVAVDCFATSVEMGPAMIGGTYYDRYERRDGVWKFAERRFEMAYTTPMKDWVPAIGTEAATAV